MSSASQNSERVCPECSRAMTPQEKQAWGICGWCETLAVEVAPPLIRGRQILKPLASESEGAADSNSQSG